MRIKNKIIYLFMLLFVCAAISPGSVVCQEDLDDIDFDSLMDDLTDGELKKSERRIENIDDDAISREYGTAKTRSFGFSEKDALMAAWTRTEGARSRDPLFLVPSRRLACDGSGFSFYPFFNMTNTLRVRPDMILNAGAVNILSIAFDDPGSMDDSDSSTLGNILPMLPFLRKMTLQERRLGGMFSTVIVDGRWKLQIETVLFLSERNFWIKDKKERTDLQKIIDKLDDIGTGSAIRTKFGLSDTRLKFGYDFLRSEWAELTFGIQGIIPTSRMWQKDPKLTIETKSGDELSVLVNDLLNTAGQLMIDPKLGTGHWGVGGFLDMRLHIIPSKLDFWSRITFDYLLEGSEHRFMPGTQLVPVQKLKELFGTGKVPDDFPLCDFFPYLVKASVRPGHIFNATFGFDWKMTEHFKLNLGYDFYSQQAEKVGKILAPNIDPSMLRIQDSVSSQVVQHKAFGEVLYEKKGKEYDWKIGLGGDLSFASQGAGRDWTVHAKLGIRF